MGASPCTGSDRARRAPRGRQTTKTPTHPPETGQSPPPPSPTPHTHPHGREGPRQLSPPTPSTGAPLTRARVPGHPPPTTTEGSGKGGLRREAWRQAGRGTHDRGKGGGREGERTGQTAAGGVVGGGGGRKPRGARRAGVGRRLATARQAQSSRRPATGRGRPVQGRRREATGQGERINILPSLCNLLFVFHPSACFADVFMLTWMLIVPAFVLFCFSLMPPSPSSDYVSFSFLLGRVFVEFAGFSLGTYGLGPGCVGLLV